MKSPKGTKVTSKSIFRSRKADEMDFLEDLLENLFDGRKKKGRDGGHHGRSGHHGRTSNSNDRPPVRCPSCGVENDPASDFCAACGASMSSNTPRQQFITCSHCNSQNATDKTFCMACGAPLKKSVPGTCQFCSSSLPAGARFCPGCGRVIPSK